MKRKRPRVFQSNHDKLLKNEKKSQKKNENACTRVQLLMLHEHDGQVSGIQGTALTEHIQV